MIKQSTDIEDLKKEVKDLKDMSLIMQKDVSIMSSAIEKLTNASVELIQTTTKLHQNMKETDELNDRVRKIELEGTPKINNLDKRLDKVHYYLMVVVMVVIGSFIRSLL